MKRRLLDLATVSTVLVSAFVFMRAGWLLAAQGRSPRTVELHSDQDPYNTASAMRYRRCQESHWRACVLQR